MSNQTDTKAATAALVAQAVEASGTSRFDLANTTHIPYTTLLRKLDGYSPFNVEELERIGRALNVDPRTLVAFEAVA